MRTSSRKVRAHGPLRVMFVVPHLGRGGAERHVATLTPAMDPARFAPSVVCLGAEGKQFAPLAAAGVPVTALHRGPRAFLAAFADLVRLMRRDRPDVVITRGFNAEALGHLAGLVAGVPRLAVWVHNCGDVGGRPFLRRLFDRFLARTAHSFYGVAYGQIPYLTEELGYPAHRIRIVQNGVDLTAAPVALDGRDPEVTEEFGIGPDEPVIGITAVLRPEKDHATLLRAMRLVTAELPATRLLVVGDGPARAEVEKLAAELGVADRTVFTGYRHDVPRLLRGMDVVTLSSHTVECFPMALLEAMATARPAVCTAVGGVPEMISEGVTGHVVPPRDPAALAEGLLRVLRDPRGARAMGEAARARLEREFTFERSVRGAEAVVEETAGRAASHRS